MATSSFKSTTKRSPIGGTVSNVDDAAASSNHNATHHRRSRSLSTFSGRSHALESDELPAATPRRRFVNTVRGSGFPEVISLDDIANDFFPLNLKDRDLDLDLNPDTDVLRESERGRSRSSSARRTSAIGATCSSATTSGSKGVSHSQEQRRGRSVSRQHGRLGDPAANASASTVKALADSCSNSRRRRSLSVARCQFSDSESDMDHSRTSSSKANLKNFTTGNYQRSSHQRPDPDHQHMKRSLSQKDLLKLYNGYSSQSSALTDDEARNACPGKYGTERTVQAVYAQRKIEHPTADGEGTALYEAMRKELRHAVEEIRTELEQTMVKTRPTVLVDGDCLQSSNSDVLQAVAIIRKNYTSKLEQSEKRKQDLLAEIVVEEQRGRELSKIVRELLPDPEKAACIEKPSCARKGSNDRSRMSKCLTEEAEKYFEDFISNVEDTDISSFDGERSDASSTLGGTRPRDYMIHCGETETYGISTGSSLPVEMDGVLLPWLRWEASNDHSPPLCKSREEATTGKSNIHDAPLEVSSRGFRVPGSYLGHSANYGPSGSWFDRDEYPHFADNEDVLFECWRQRRRINSGGLILCSSTFL
ncbi:uncharacterized protein LOC122073662 isoform X1 [Macadamia integrifolia]|uniref:uncharacterized protein LOC122073662 isoform X1 n=1 Tax=Macadamia integrifolia TaxID=60698 RepID=UPI001C4F80BB|nr:uncharacterized protein LOC122073662 isoform X1 [Macadamia integrifolia]